MSYISFNVTLADLCFSPSIILISQTLLFSIPPMDHDSASRMIKDDREKTKPERSVFAEKDLTDKVDSYWGRA
jgi:hypothetical protein